MFPVIFTMLTLSAGVQVNAEPVTIAVLGDSLVQGYGLAPDDGFVPQLQRWLDDQGQDTFLLNAGVSGDTTAGGAARIDWTLSPDVQGLVVSLGANDMLRGIDPETAQENLRTILTATSLRDLPVLLVGIEAPSNFGPKYKQDFATLYEDLSAEFGTLYHASFLGALLNQDNRADTLENLMQADGIHPNAQGVALIVADMGPMVGELAKIAMGSE